ncbi:MAG: hypothetical protein AB7P56_01695 [Nitrososphaeraceae archaeon]
MSRRRKFNKVSLITTNIFLESADMLMKLKYRRPAQDDLVKRSIAEWEDLKEYRLNMDVVFEIERQTD